MEVDPDSPSISGFNTDDKNDYDLNQSDEDESSENSEDPDENQEVEEEGLSDDIKNHPAARNSPYKWPEGYEEDPDDIINIDELEDAAYEEIMRNPLERPGEAFIPPTERSDVPLLGILHPQLEDVDPR